MRLPRLSARARARWALVVGVVVAGTLAGGSLVALNRDVLPFGDWPSFSARPDGSQRLPDAPAQSRDARRGRPTPNAGTAVVLAPPAAATPAPIAAAPARTTPAASLLERSTGAAGSVGRDRDSDSDGIPNSVEHSAGTNPTSSDSDGDGLPDGWESQNGLDPTNPRDAAADPDNDGLTNATEYKAGESRGRATPTGTGAPTVTTTPTATA
jgi:Bacterial TSP3 repeat